MGWTRGECSVPAGGGYIRSSDRLRAPNQVTLVQVETITPKTLPGV